MEEIICYCKNISLSEIQQAMVKGAKTLQEIKDITGACTGNKCREMNPKGKCCSGEIIGILKIESEKDNEKCNCCEG